MKTTKLLIIAMLITCLGCVTKEIKPVVPEVAFAIFETLRPDTLPVALWDTLMRMGFQDEKDDQLATIGYIAKDEPIDFSKCLPDASIKLLKTHYTIDTERKYHGIVAVRPDPLLDNSAILKAKQVNYSVELYFTMKGAKAWAEVTRNHTGKTVAFVIDDEVYSLSTINAEIRTGMARIDGFENTDMAKKMADSILP